MEKCNCLVCRVRRIIKGWIPNIAEEVSKKIDVQRCEVDEIRSEINNLTLEIREIKRILAELKEEIKKDP